MRDAILTALAWAVLATGAGAWVVTVARSQNASIDAAYAARGQ